MLFLWYSAIELSICIVVFFFFKQKTAYEMRISDWSSDVCSSDLDPVGMARAAVLAVQNYGTGRRMQGASTITQQLARNIFLSNSYTWARKMREMVLSLALEWKFSKDEIIELYLNKVYFGGGSYGIDAASNSFFGHSATAMSLSEAAVVAGLVKAPSRYSPTDRKS